MYAKANNIVCIGVVITPIRLGVLEWLLLLSLFGANAEKTEYCFAIKIQE